MLNIDIQLMDQTFNALQTIADYEAKNISHSDFGASSIFIGKMRDFNQNNSVKSMFLEHYPQMTVNILYDIAKQHRNEYHISTAESVKCHSGCNIFICHRVGKILPKEDIVIVAVWSAHRQQAFYLCQNIMEDLKSKAPFWKQETLVNNDKVWVKSEH